MQIRVLLATHSAIAIAVVSKQKFIQDHARTSKQTEFVVYKLAAKQQPALILRDATFKAAIPKRRKSNVSFSQ